MWPTTINHTYTLAAPTDGVDLDRNPLLFETPFNADGKKESVAQPMGISMSFKFTIQKSK